MLLRSMADEATTEQYVDDAAKWVLDAGQPYLSWFFGNRETAGRIVAAWMRRPSSELYVGRMTLLLDGSRTGGGFLALPGDELARCRRADAVASINAVPSSERGALMGRAKAAGDLFQQVDSDEFYLSKVGLLPEWRGIGWGRKLVEAYMVAGLARGFRRLRLDVHSDNIVARRLYTSLGFEVVTETRSSISGLSYLALAFRVGYR